MNSDHGNNCTFISSTFKVKKIKCLYFLEQTSFEGDISFLSIWDLWGGFRHLHETTKIPQLTRMNSYHENKYTFVSPTFKVEENKVTLFFCSEIRLLKYELFVFSKCMFLCKITNHENVKKLISPSNEVWPNK